MWFNTSMQERDFSNRFIPLDDPYLGAGKVAAEALDLGYRQPGGRVRAKITKQFISHTGEGAPQQEKAAEELQPEGDSLVTDYANRKTRFGYWTYNREADTQTERGIDTQPEPALVGAPQHEAAMGSQPQRSRVSQVQPHVVAAFFGSVNVIPREKRPAPVTEQTVSHATPVEIPKTPTLWGRYRHRGRHRR
jgi:hypothetical protein